jgi:hypothetical protein
MKSRTPLRIHRATLLNSCATPLSHLSTFRSSAHSCFRRFSFQVPCFNRTLEGLVLNQKCCYWNAVLEDVGAKVRIRKKCDRKPKLAKYTSRFCKFLRNILIFAFSPRPVTGHTPTGGSPTRTQRVPPYRAFKDYRSKFRVRYQS